MVHVIRIGVILVGSLAAIAQAQRSTICDDASTVSDTCGFALPNSDGTYCGENEVFALQNGCYLCVDATTCLSHESSEEHEESAQQAPVDNGEQPVDEPTEVDNPMPRQEGGNESTTTPSEESEPSNEDGAPAESETGGIEGSDDTNQFESTQSGGETSPETESEPVPDTQSDAGTQPEEDTSPVAESQPEQVSEPQPEVSDAQPETDSEPQPSVSETQPEAESEPQPEVSDGADNNVEESETDQSVQVDTTTVPVDAESEPEGDNEPEAVSPLDPEGQMEGVTEPEGDTQPEVPAEDPETQEEDVSEGKTNRVDNESVPDESKEPNADTAVPNILLIPDHEQASLSVDQFRMRAEPQAVDGAPIQSLKDVSNWYFAIPAFLAIFSVGIALRARFSDRSRDFERLPDEDEEEINPFCDGQQECDLEFAGQGDSDESGEHGTNAPIPSSPVMSAC